LASNLAKSSTKRLHPAWDAPRVKRSMKMKFALDNAMRALELAKQCGGELDIEQYEQAYKDLAELRAAIVRYDQRLNDQEIAPTGDDYNEVMSFLGLNSSSLAYRSHYPVKGLGSKGNQGETMENVFSYLDLSTGHVSKKTMEWLNAALPIESHCHGLTIAPYEYGAFVSVPSKAETIDERECPDDLKTVLKFAQQKSCSIVRFDRDGETIEDLPYFNWSEPCPICKWPSEAEAKPFCGECSPHMEKLAS
jgi:hypothetical protein